MKSQHNADVKYNKGYPLTKLKPSTKVVLFIKR